MTGELGELLGPSADPRHQVSGSWCDGAEHRVLHGQAIHSRTDGLDHPGRPGRVVAGHEREAVLHVDWLRDGQLSDRSGFLKLSSATAHIARPL